jgi:hypothetical protein
MRVFGEEVIVISKPGTDVGRHWCDEPKARQCSGRVARHGISNVNVAAGAHTVDKESGCRERVECSVVIGVRVLLTVPFREWFGLYENVVCVTGCTRSLRATHAENDE